MTCVFVRWFNRLTRVAMGLTLCGAALAGEPVAEAEFFEWLPATGSSTLFGPHHLNQNGDVLVRESTFPLDPFYHLFIEGLSHPIQTTESFAAISASRTAVGQTASGFAIRFDYPGTITIGPFGLKHSGINNAGVIVGFKDGGDPPLRVGYKLENGQLVFLGSEFVPAGVDASGRVFGTIEHSSFYMSDGDGPPKLIGNFGGSSVVIHDVTERGDFAGAVFVDSEPSSRPFVYVNNQPRLLNAAAGVPFSRALSVTTDGRAIGVDQPDFVLQDGWVERAGERVPLEPLFTSLLGYEPDLRFYSRATENGWISGFGRTPEGVERLFRAKIRVDANTDTDGDGILDDWEENGVPYTDSKGAERRYMLPNADPARKDLYVEVDGGTFPLSNDSIARIVFAFDQAPVAIPDGSTGVRLHVFKDEFDLPLPNSVVVSARRFPENYPVIKSQRFGAPSERQGPDAAALLAAKAKAFRYCLVYDGIEFQNGVDAYSGLGRIGGGDFVIDLGLPVLRDGVRDIDEVAGLFMHELGHNLGLEHGGGDAVHGKPNYVSVMNYAFSMPKPFSARFWRLDYSREELATLQENDLSEAAGINSMLYRGVSMPFGVGPELARSMRLVKLSGRPTNFDGSAGPPSGVVDADLNFIGSGAGIPGTTTPSPGQPLAGHNDWASLVYAIDAELVIRTRGDLDDGFPDGCPTADSIAFLTEHVPEPCHPDIDGDEFIGFADLNAVISRFNTAEGDAAYDAAADIDVDGVIGFSDLNEILGRFNQPCD